MDVTVDFLSEKPLLVEIKCVTEDGDIVRITTQKKDTSTSTPYIANENAEQITIVSIVEKDEPDVR